MVPLKPTSDQMSARVRVTIEALPTYAGAKLARVEVVGADGKAFKSVSTFGDFESGKKHQCFLYFDTPTGFEFKRLQVEDLSFELAEGQLHK